MAYAVWHMQETEDEFKRYAQAAGLCLPPRTIQHPTKRLEWLAARLAYLVAAEALQLPRALILKNAQGTPYRSDGRAYISLSHCFPFAIGMVSKDKPIGVDLQIPNAKLQTAQPKYVTFLERLDAKQDLEKLCIYWCAKECVYKIANCQGLGLTAIEVTPFTKQEKGWLQGHIGEALLYHIHYRIEKDYTMAWCYAAHTAT